MSDVAWHDIECGAYTADLPMWRELAEAAHGPVLDIGAGTGRVALDLAARGIRVVALDHDPVLLDALHERALARDLAVETVLADARNFHLPSRFALIIAPMQTVQLFGGPEGRGSFLRTAAAHLRPAGHLAVALAGPLEPWDREAHALPVPDVGESGGVVRTSQPIRVTEDEVGWSIERVRLTSVPGRPPEREQDVITLERVLAPEFEAEASAAGLLPAGRRVIASTDEHIGTTVVILARA